MKQQIARLSPHQNAKVLAMLMFVSSLVFVVPFMLVSFSMAPAEARPPVLMFLGMPVLYLVIGYVGVAIACAVYNAMYKLVGGIEFESRGIDV